MLLVVGLVDLVDRVGMMDLVGLGDLVVLALLGISVVSLPMLPGVSINMCLNKVPRVGDPLVVNLGLTE